MNHEINYSIIIPHKNIPNLLQRCLDSIPRRNDVQIIVIDDNSDYDKVDFKHFPGLGDPFVEVVFTKEGKGAGYARNVGLEKAVGKWLLFADADDFFNYCVNDIFDEYVNSNVDIIYFKHNSINSDTYTTTLRCNIFNTYIDYWMLSKKKAVGYLRYNHVCVWAILFKNEFIKKHSILFDEIYISNDVTFSYMAGYYASSIYADSRALYCTTIRQGSIRRSRKTTDNKLDMFYVSAKCYRFFCKHGISFFNEISFTNTLIKFLVFNRTYFLKAREILFNLGFTSSEIIGLCIYNILIYVPSKIVSKLCPDNIFHPVFR